MESGDFHKEPSEILFRVTRIWYVNATTAMIASKRSRNWNTVDSVEYMPILEEND